MDLIPRGFDDLFDDFMAPMPPKPPKHENMKCDIYEKDDKYHIEMDVPGFTKDDIKIEVIITKKKSYYTSSNQFFHIFACLNVRFGHL